MNKNAAIPLDGPPINLDNLKHYSITYRLKEMHNLMSVCIKEASYEEKFSAFINLADNFDRLNTDILGGFKNDDDFLKFIQDKNFISAFNRAFS